MGHSLTHNNLKKTIGTIAQNADGLSLGHVVDVTRGASGERAQYIILRSSEFFGGEDRYFAVPASSTFIDLNVNNNVLVLRLNRDDLQLAKGVPMDECPPPNKQFGESIYEVYNYTATT